MEVIVMTKKTSIFILSLLSFCALNAGNDKWTDWIQQIYPHATYAAASTILMHAITKSSNPPLCVLGKIAMYGLGICIGPLAHICIDGLTMMPEKEDPLHTPKTWAMRLLPIVALVSSIWYDFTT